MNDNPAMSPADEQAAFWLFRIDVGLSAQEEAEFAAWIAESEDHLLAWERGLKVIESIDQDDDPLIDAMRTDALLARPAAIRTWRVALGAAAAVVIGLVGLLSWQSLSSPRLAPGGTAVTVASNEITNSGAPRTAALPDGSVVTLDRETALAVNFSPMGREVRVLHGRALFDVRHEGRTFKVEASDVTITDVGTRFSVQLRADGVVAVLQHGRIAVSRRGNPATTALLPGQSLTALIGKPFRISAVDPGAAFDWSANYIEFRDTPLDQAVAQINKHNATPIRVVGSAARLRITGRFRADDPPGFVLAVTAILPVRQHVARDGIVELVAQR